MVSDTADSFPNGSIIIVDPDLQAQPGDYVIVLSHDQQKTFKQLVQEGGELILQALNPNYPSQALGSATIVGVVREVTRRFR